MISRDHAPAHPSRLKGLSQRLLKAAKASGNDHRKRWIAGLQLGSHLRQHRHQVVQFLRPGGGQEQQQAAIALEPQLPAGFAAAQRISRQIHQGMAHPGDRRAMGLIEGGLIGKDRQDAIGELQQAGGAAVVHAPGPFLGSDVIGDGHLGKLAAQALAQTHVGAHVVDQHHRIRRPLQQLAVHPGLQLQGWQHLGQVLQQPNRTQRGCVSKELSASGLHAGAAEGQHLQRDPARCGLTVQRLHQQAALQITRHLTGADQHAHH